MVNLIQDNCDHCEKEFRNTELTYRFEGKLVCKDCYDMLSEADNIETMWLY